MEIQARTTKERRFKNIDDSIDSDDSPIKQDENNQSKLEGSYGESAFNQLPQASNFVEKQYSLQADIFMGWQPKVTFCPPIELKFDDNQLNYLIDTLLYEQSIKQQNPYQLIYLGFRPTDSFVLHESFSGDETYYFKQLNMFKEQFFSILDYLVENNLASDPRDKLGPRNYLGMSKDYQENIKFDSYFEAGNLDCAIKIDSNHYDLYMRNDSNTRGHNQWFYFKITGAQKGQTLNLNVCNFTKPQSLYQQGMKPYIFSKKNFQKTKQKWKQDGENIQYQQRATIYDKILNQVKQFQTEQIIRSRTYYKLSFDYTFQYDNDEVYFSYCIPYTFSKLTKFLKKRVNAQKKPNGIGNNYIDQNILCQTLSGVDVPLLTITNFQNLKDKPLTSRKMVIMQSRIHPGESNGSWMMHGFLKFILGNSNEAKQLRDQVIFKVVPMINIDGVILGNYRTGFQGRDLNRAFKNPNKDVVPIVVAIQDLVQKYQRDYGKNIIAFFDFHGHSCKKNVFIYGPGYPIFEPNYYRCRYIPKMLSKTCEMFRFYQCKFAISKCKQNTARASVFNQLNLANCFTVEASFQGYLDKSNKNIPFIKQNLLTMGQGVGDTIHQYWDKISKYEILRQKDKQLKQSSKSFIVRSNTDDTSSTDTSFSKNTIFQKSSLKEIKLESITEKSKKKQNINKMKSMILNKVKSKKKVVIKQTKKSFDEDDFDQIFKNEIEDIKIDDEKNKNYVDPDDRDHSDSESSDEDFNADELKLLNKKIVKNKQFFEKVFKDKFFLNEIQNKQNKKIFDTIKKPQVQEIQKPVLPFPQQIQNTNVKDDNQVEKIAPKKIIRQDSDENQQNMNFQKVEVALKHVTIDDSAQPTFYLDNKNYKQFHAKGKLINFSKQDSLENQKMSKVNLNFHDILGYKDTPKQSFYQSQIQQKSKQEKINYIDLNCFPDFEKSRLVNHRNNSFTQKNIFHLNQQSPVSQQIMENYGFLQMSKKFQSLNNQDKKLGNLKLIQQELSQLNNKTPIEQNKKPRLQSAQKSDIVQNEDKEQLKQSAKFYKLQSKLTNQNQYQGYSNQSLSLKHFIELDRNPIFKIKDLLYQHKQ